jgi:hypothetical protein
MHDWTLKRIEFDWRSARVTIELEDVTFAARTLIAENVKELQVPRANEWGPSVSVNKVSAIERLPSGMQRLRIEMQSGDVVQIVAERFTLPVA